MICDQISINLCVFDLLVLVETYNSRQVFGHSTSLWYKVYNKITYFTMTSSQHMTVLTKSRCISTTNTYDKDTCTRRNGMFQCNTNFSYNSLGAFYVSVQVIFLLDPHPLNDLNHSHPRLHKKPRAENMRKRNNVCYLTSIILYMECLQTES